MKAIPIKICVSYVAVNPCMNPLTPKAKGIKPLTAAAKLGKIGEQQRSGGKTLLKNPPTADDVFCFCLFFLKAYIANGTTKAIKIENKKAKNKSSDVKNLSEINPTRPPV